MSRYISQINDLTLLSGTSNITPPVNDPQPVAAYNFYRGELIVGDPADTGDEIVYADLMEVLPSASGNAKYGLDKWFFEAPYLDENATLDVGTTYKVIFAPVTYNSVVLDEHDTFLCVSGHTSFTGSGTVAKELDAQYRTTQELNQRANAYQLAFLDSNRDQASWNDKTWQTDTPDNPHSWTR